jgi:hypothetical protein
MQANDSKFSQEQTSMSTTQSRCIRINGAKRNRLINVYTLGGSDWYLHIKGTDAPEIVGYILDLTYYFRTEVLLAHK